jgi:glutathione synthase/RimK-type ligase-like ATP-grasp enzyme
MNMLVGIQKDPDGKFCKFLKRYEDILDYNNVKHIKLDLNQQGFWKQVAKLDLFILRWRQTDDYRQIARTIIPIVEKEMGIKCFPDIATCWHYDDKVRQYYLLMQYGFPVVKSWIFWNRKKALKWLETVEFPIVFKLKGGAGSNNVVLVLGGNILRKLRGEDISPYWHVHKNYVFFQKFLPNNPYDTRITVIGDRAFAFRRFNRDNDFRSSGSGRIDYGIEKIDEIFVKKAFEITHKMKFQSMAYDFLYDEYRQPRFCEISYTYDDWAVHACPGYWDSSLNWHEGHYWPQYFQLMDALNLPDLKQPEM